LVKLVGFVFLSLFANVALGQQKEGTLDVGGVGLRYADTLNATAAAITPTIRFDWPNVTVDGSGTLSQFRAGGWSTQGELSSSVFTQTPGTFLGELSATLAGSAHQDRTRTGESIASARLHFMRATLGGFVGGGGGLTWDGFGWGRLWQAELGGWARYQRGMAQLTLTPVSVNDSIKYADSQLFMSWRSERADLLGLVGTRTGRVVPAIGSSEKSWGSLTAVFWLTPRIGLTASGGSYPVDLAQGFPGGRFVSLALRFASARRHQESTSTTDSARFNPPITVNSTPDLTAFWFERRPGGIVQFSVRAPQARTVELIGDFTSWVPVELHRSSNDVWITTLPILPGKYEMNTRIDGGKWLVPQGLLSVSDEFGGAVGILVIE
jgi:hypothetical protein